MSTIPNPNMIYSVAAQAAVGSRPGALLVLLVLLGLVAAYIAMVVQATLLVARRGNGVEVPVWIFAIVMLPFIGAIGAAAHFRNR